MHNFLYPESNLFFERKESDLFHSCYVCKGILPFVKTYATKCSSYYRDVIVCSCLIEAEEAGGKEYKKSIENGFCQSIFHTRVIKFEKIHLYVVVSCYVEIDCVRCCFLYCSTSNAVVTTNTTISTSERTWK